MSEASLKFHMMLSFLIPEIFCKVNLLTFELRKCTFKVNLPILSYANRVKSPQDLNPETPNAPTQDFQNKETDMS